MPQTQPDDERPATAVGEQLEALVKQQARTTVEAREEAMTGGNRAQRRAAAKRRGR